jgi:hypothetical protein
MGGVVNVNYAGGNLPMRASALHAAVGDGVDDLDRA